MLYHRPCSIEMTPKIKQTFSGEPESSVKTTCPSDIAAGIKAEKLKDILQTRI